MLSYWDNKHTPFLFPHTRLKLYVSALGALALLFLMTEHKSFIELVCIVTVNALPAAGSPFAILHVMPALKALRGPLRVGSCVKQGIFWQPWKRAVAEESDRMR